MDKYAVELDEDDEKVKTAEKIGKVIKCPMCGSDAPDRHCPNCGTKPFEKRPTTESK